MPRAGSAIPYPTNTIGAADIGRGRVEHRQKLRAHKRASLLRTHEFKQQSSPIFRVGTGVGLFPFLLWERVGPASVGESLGRDAGGVR